MTSDQVMRDMAEGVVQEAGQLKEAANVLYKQKEYAAAIQQYTHAITLTPNNPLLYSNRALCHSILYNMPQAIHDYSQSLLLDPSLFKIYPRLAKAYMISGCITEAISTLQKAKKLSSYMDWDLLISNYSNIQSTILSISDYIAQFHFSKALALFASINIDNTPFDSLCTDWILLKIQCLFSTSAFIDALPLLQKLSSSDPRNPKILLWRALLLYTSDLNGVDHVKKILQQALAYDPDFIIAVSVLKRIKSLDLLKTAGNEFFKNSDFNSALEKYSEFIKTDSLLLNELGISLSGIVRVKVLSNRATVFSKLSNLDDTINDCTEAISILNLVVTGTLNSTPEDAKNSHYDSLYSKIHLRRADAYLKKSRQNDEIELIDDAIRDYNFCLGVSPTPEIKAALQSANRELKQRKRKDYYKILNVSRDASDSEIKKAYRKLALLYHPDKQASLPEEERLACDSKFKNVSEAYSVLSDPEKKRMFDSGVDIDGASASGGGHHGAQMDDLMQMFMNGGGGGFHSEFGRGGHGGHDPFGHSRGGFSFHFG